MVILTSVYCHKNVGFFGILVFGKALVGFASDGWQRKIPAEAERTVSCAGVIGECELRAEARTSRGGGDGNAHGHGASHRIGRELFTHPANGAAAFG